jgi:hypothetical protein
MRSTTFSMQATKTQPEVVWTDAWVLRRRSVSRHQDRGKRRLEEVQRPDFLSEHVEFLEQSGCYGVGLGTDDHTLPCT